MKEKPPKQLIRFYFDQSTIAKIQALPSKTRSQVVENLLNQNFISDEQIELEVNHIFESGANEIRVIELIKKLLKR